MNGVLHGLPLTVLTLLMTSLLLGHTAGLRYLLMPMMSASHILRLGSVGRSLTERGNSVYMILHRSVPVPSQLLDADIHYIIYHTHEQNHFINTKHCSDIYTSLETDPASAVPKLLDFFDQQCTDLLENEKLFNELKVLDLDFALVDGFSSLQCFLAYPRRLNIPYATLSLLPPMDSFSTTLQFNFITPTLPIAMSEYPVLPSLKHRVRQWFTITVMSLIMDYRQDSTALHKFLEETPIKSFSDLRDGVSLWLVDSHPIVDVGKPTVPRVVYLGGLVTGPGKALPNDLAEFADFSRRGLIVVSFGTVISHIPIPEFNQILQALNNLTENVILATKMRVTIPLRDGIMVKQWIPQNDLLAHPNTRLFITHCGSSSQHQALYHGIPMLGIPFQEEQKSNAQRMEAKLYGRYIDRKNLTATRIIEEVYRVKNDQIIQEEVTRASEIMKDRLQDPETEAAYWLDHVARYGHAHLKSYTENLSWHQVLMMDVLAVLAASVCALLITLSIFCRICVKLLRRLFGSKL